METNELIEKAKDRDSDAFTELMQAHLKDLYRAAFAILMNIEDAEAIEEGIRDAVSYDGTISSELVIDGKKAVRSGDGINPQTAIGQCEDGTVLLLVIDGRQENSLGATKSDVADIMLECGAVNAVSMVGGSYTAMNVADENVNNSFRVDGTAVCPDAWLVK